MPRFSRADIAKIAVIAVAEYGLFRGIDALLAAVASPGPVRDIGVVVLSVLSLLLAAVVLLRWLDVRRPDPPATSAASAPERSSAPPPGRDAAKAALLALAESGEQEARRLLGSKGLASTGIEQDRSDRLDRWEGDILENLRWHPQSAETIFRDVGDPSGDYGATAYGPAWAVSMAWRFDRRARRIRDVMAKPPWF